MSFVLYGIVMALVAWAAYNVGWSRGSADGYEDGWKEGLKKGTDDGMKAGLKAGIKEQMISSLVDKPQPSSLPHPEVHEQVRNELLTALQPRQSAKQKPVPVVSSGVLLPVLQKFGWWLGLCLLIVVVAYLGR